MFASFPGSASPRNGPVRGSFLAFVFAAFFAGYLSAGDVGSLEARLGSRIEVFSVIRQIEAKSGFLVLDAPSEHGKVLKRITDAGTVNAKARTIREGRTYYLSDWSWDRYVEEDIAPNWVFIEGAAATVDSERVIRDSSGPLVSLRYVTLRRHALPLLLNRDPALNVFLGSRAKVHVAENEALAALAEMAKRYPVTLPPGYTYSDVNYTKNVDASRTRTQIRGTYENFSFFLLPSEYFPDAYIADINRVLRNAGMAFWGSEYDESEPLPRLYENLSQGFVSGEGMAFHGHMEPALLLDYLRGDEYSKDSLPFYEDLLKRKVPPDFFEMSVEFNECGDGWSVNVSPRSMSFKVLILENVSSRSLQVGDLVVKTAADVPIGPALDEAGMIPKRMGESAPVSLAPGDQMILPMHLSFPTRLPDESSLWILRSDEFWLVRPDRSRVEAALRPFSEVGFRSFSMIGDERPPIDFRLSKEQFLRCCFNPVRGSGKDYYFGPVVLPTSARIDGADHSLSRFEPDSVLVSAAYEMGSCPTIYAVDRWQQRKRVGHFLTGRGTPEKEGYYRMPLPEFGGVLDIVEEDSETSYFRWLRVRYRDEGGEVRYADPDHSVLKRGNSEYLDFDKGDRLRVRFPGFEPENAPGEIWLEGVGYYVPYEGVRTSRNAR
jgi:hypothetical protein